MIKQIGGMVYKLRKQLGISQGVLCGGLCSVSDLSKFEYGNRELDNFTLSALLQRFGKSLYQFEMAVSKDEYQIFVLRALIREYLQEGFYEETFEVLSEYECNIEIMKKPVHQQYIAMMRAVLGYLLSKNIEETLILLDNALMITVQDRTGFLVREGYLCRQEMQILVLMAYLYMESEQVDLAENILKEMIQNYEKREAAYISKSSIYSKCCYLLATIYVQEGKNEEILCVVNKGIDYLIKDGSMAFLDSLLKIRQMYSYDDMVEKELEALNFLCQFNDTSNNEMVLKLLFFGNSGEVLVSNELLREMRTAQGKSQESLCDGICTRETLSNIELGRSAHRKNLKMLLQKLGVSRTTYYSYVEVDDIETYEMISEYKRRFFKGEKNITEDFLKEIEQKLDLTIPVNKQFIEATKILDAKREKTLSNEQIIKGLVECLKYTMPEYNGSICRVPYREEVAILNTIALTYKKMKQFEKALQIYESIFKKYEESMVEFGNHIYSMQILYLNYSLILEEAGYLDKAEKYGKQGLKLMAQKQRGGVTGHFLGNLACVYDKYNTQASTEICKQYSNHAYYLLKLFRCEEDSKIMKKFYDNRF